MEGNFSAELIQDKQIAIVGGGPGGLSLARMLQIRGGQVTVYERDASRMARVQGSSLDLHADSGQLLIQAAGLMEAFAKVARPEGEQHRIYDKHGCLVLDIPAYQVASSRPEIDRGVLRDLLLDALKPGTVQWNKRFVALEATAAGGYLLTFEDGSRAQVDIVIAADGANSRIRPYITDIRPHYSGTTLIQGEVEKPAISCPEVHEMVHQGNMIVLGDEKGLMLQQKGDGTLIFYATAKHPEHWVRTVGIDFAVKAKAVDFLTQFYAGWNPAFFTLFNASSHFVPRPMYGTPVHQQWDTQPALTMIGDAAHVMPPFAGVGVNMAMLDALELANCLTDPAFTDVTAAIHAYEIAMLARSAAAQERTKTSEDIFHAPTAIADLLKKLGCKAAAGGRF
ncbi:FAD-dependent oxidoreductase [Chitinophaga sp. 30R24]|uniref:FAD-dependent oxidoreductase n=1 Tax=Chitinophaga sp. 30R24 TaxID=3248838 RepID=UPI003B8F3B40